MEKYLPRIVDVQLVDELAVFGGVLITGPKWCGKTTTAKQSAGSCFYMQENEDANIELARANSYIVFDGDSPRLIDEWQVEPTIWNKVRFRIDQSGETGLYILTGSAIPKFDARRHSGTGRISRVRMRTMSLFESGDSSGEVSLRSLFDGCKAEGTSRLSYEETADVLVRGGWPGTIGRSQKAARDIVRGYCESMVEADTLLPDGRRYDRSRMRTLLRSLARNTASEATNTLILADINGRDGNVMSINTLSDYVSVLKDIFVVEDLDAWCPMLRSKATVRSSPTRHFTDPAVAAYFLSAGPTDLLNDVHTYGLLFESLAIRDLRIYAQSLGGDVFHYRDSGGLEADAIVHLHDGRWGAVEVKLGMRGVEDGVKSLLRLRDRVDSEKMGAPAFLAVIISSGYAYTREDGVHVIPLACLKNRYCFPQSENS